MGMLYEYSDEEKRLLMRGLRAIDDVGPEGPMTPERAAKIVATMEGLRELYPARKKASP